MLRKVALPKAPPQGMTVAKAAKPARVAKRAHAVDGGAAGVIADAAKAVNR